MWSMLFALGMSLGASHAAAQEQTAEERLEEARRSYRDGLSLEAAGDWARALRRFEAVAEVRLTPQVRFHIARSKEKLGRLTEALGEYRLAEYEATDLSETELTEIRRARESLESRIPRLHVTTSGVIGGATISLDGVEIGRDRLGVALPVDPGEHRVVIRFEDGRVEEYVIEVLEGQTRILELVIESKPKNLPPSSTGSVRRTDDAVPWWSWVAGGVGAGALIAGGILFYLRQDDLDTLSENCERGICRKEYRDEYDRVRNYSVLAPVAMTFGAAAVGVGVYGWALAPTEASASRRSAPSVRRSTAVLPMPLGVTLRGSF